MVTSEITDFVADAKFEDLPEAVVHEVKRLLLDSIACALGGLTTEKGKLAIQLARRLGGPPESTLIGVGDRVSASHAAFANGELINAMDWDAGGVPPGHSTPSIVAASLALAESEQACGRELVLAVALGHEISGRLGLVLTNLQEPAKESPFQILPPVHGYSMHALGSVAAAGKLLKLERRRMSSAFGIAGYNAPVPAMVKWYKSTPAALIKYASTGWIAQVGVTAALLADIGYTGDESVLDGDHGFWRFTASDENKWNPKRLIEGLGRSWLLQQRGTTFYKHYPFCGLCHTQMDGFLKIIGENDLGPADIESIKVLGGPLIGEPVFTNTAIETHVDAQFSVPYVFAVAAHGIRIGTEWQSAAVMRDAGIREFMKKVGHGVHPEGLTLIEVAARGRVFRKECRPGLPVLTDADIIGKFEQNARPVLSSAKVDKVRNLVLELETLSNVSEVTSALGLC